MKLQTLPIFSLGGIFAQDAAPDANPSKIVDYNTPALYSSSFLQESFDSGIPDSFTHTSADPSKYNGNFESGALNDSPLNNDLGLLVPAKARHYGIASELSKPFIFNDNENLVVSYEVAFQSGIECGGAYVKLLADQENLDVSNFDDKTRFSIMFGPDKCANDYKLHLILNHKNPITGEFEEKHLAKKPEMKVLQPFYNDAKPHVYQLILSKDNSFKITVDGKSISSGNLLKDMSPSINPPAEIEDPDATKPEDWDERAKIADPEATKPEDWDETQPEKIVDDSATMPDDWREDLEVTIDDPESVMPEDWDEDMDGEYEAPQIDNPDCADISGCGAWEAPLIDNPLYKGKWKAPMIDNPNFQGIWSKPMIANPDFFEDNNPFDTASTIKALAVEIWTMSDGIYFDNFLVSNSVEDAGEFVKNTFDLKVKQAKLNQPSLLEKAKKAAESNSKLVVGSVLGVGVFTILMYFLCFKTSKKAGSEEIPERESKVKFAEKNEEKVISEENSAEEEEEKEDKAEEEEEEEEQGEKIKEISESDNEPEIASSSAADDDEENEEENDESSEAEVLSKDKRPRNLRRRNRAD